MVEIECCICLNSIEDSNIFRLDCCKHVVHHDCIVNWINTNIDRKLPDYNKCILCKSYNNSIDDYYKDLLTTRRTNTYINLDNSSNQFIINVDENNTTGLIIQTHTAKLACICIFSIGFPFLLVYLLLIATESI